MDAITLNDKVIMKQGNEFTRKYTRESGFILTIKLSSPFHARLK